MSENSMLIVGIVALILITAGLTYYITKASVPLPFSNQTNASGQAPTITVTGEASETVAPDRVSVGLTISTVGPDTATSETENAAETAKVTAALFAAGVNESDIQTDSYSTYPAYNQSCSACYPEPDYTYGTNEAVPANGATPASAKVPETSAPTATVTSSGGSSSGAVISPGYPVPSPPELCGNTNNCAIIGYTTTHSITITNGNTNDGGKYVQAALNASNSTAVDYVYFSLSDAESIQVESALQTEAAANAKMNAQNIAESLGAHLGSIVAINPSYRDVYPVYAYQSAAVGTTASAPSVPPAEIYPTTTDMSNSITVVYALVQ